MIRNLVAALALLIPAVATAQTVTITSPNTVNPAGQPKAVTDVFVRNADGTIATISGAGGGSSSAVAQGSTTSGQTGPLVQCAVVTGNQAYAVGTTNPLNCINTGRLKVAVSNAGNIDPATQLTTTLTADIVGAKYYASRPTWTDGSTGVIQVDATGNLYVNNATLPPNAASQTTLAAIAGQLPTSLGAKTSATSLSIAPATDATFPVTVNTTATSATGAPPVATTAVASSLVLKASAGNLYSLNVTAGATAGFVMLFNATAAPADGTVAPAKCIPLAANTGIELNYRATPTYFGTGITAVFSSTGCFSKTASATAYISGDVK